jgi:subtilisin family serine protease
MKSYLVQTHENTDQGEYSQFLLDLGATIFEDYSEFPSLYLISVSNTQMEEVQNNKETKTVEEANKQATKFSDFDLDEVGNEIQKGEMEEKATVLAAGEQTLGITDNWGLGRIDERARGDSKKYIYEKTGQNVDVYIIDSGVNPHSDLEGRIVNLWTGFNIFEDEDGHGTHVASTVAGRRYGVAKQAQIYNVKVFDANVSSPITTIVAGCNEALKHHRKKIAEKQNRPSVVNMSLGGDGSMLNLVVAEMQKAGMVVCVAAGNEKGDLDNDINVYPAESPNVLTINSLNSIDRLSWFNNYGSVCDICAPGEEIIAADYSNSTGWARMSGTSMATPHVAGVCALALEGKPIYTSKNQVDSFYSFILEAATTGQIFFDGGWTGFSSRFSDRIVYSLVDDAPAPAPVVPVPPVPEEKEGGSKKWIFIAAGVIVLGIILAVAL